jgi:hypothetical protein
MGSFASVSLARPTTSRHPKTGRLLRVEIADQIVTDRVIDELLGTRPPRSGHLNRAEEAQGLDVQASQQCRQCHDGTTSIRPVIASHREKTTRT